MPVGCLCVLRILQRVHVYEAVSYEGEPEESEEMRPQWFRVTELPLKVRYYPHLPPFRRTEPGLSVVVTHGG